ncbi:PH domain-containing protein [Streptomyces sp. NPDC058773]|uniref:PH domain-containing protein n=1 Tax=Streptomyces sp. NPDC058773 TaxID=3346632 RepID=UPI003678A727
MDQVKTPQLRPPACTFDRRFIVWWRIRLAISALFVVTGCGVLTTVLLGVRSVWPWAGAGIQLAVLVPAVLLLPVLWYRLHRWEVTDTAVYVRTGYLRREWAVIPISRIQTVDTLRGPLRQRLRLATVLVSTASSKGELTLHGLADTTAVDLARRLIETAQATPGDAT